MLVEVKAEVGAPPRCTCPPQSSADGHSVYRPKCPDLFGINGLWYAHNALCIRSYSSRYIKKLYHNFTIFVVILALEVWHNTLVLACLML